MSILKINLREQKGKALAIIAVFAGLYAVGNFLAIPGIASHDHVFLFIVAILFGPWVSALSGIIGELIVLPIGFKPEHVFFFPTTFAGVVIMALIIGYGRKLAFQLEKKKNWTRKKARIVAETLAYIIGVNVRYLIYIPYDMLLIGSGIDVGGTILVIFLTFILPKWIYKTVWTPLCILIGERLRKSLNRIYYDIELPELPIPTES